RPQDGESLGGGLEVLLGRSHRHDDCTTRFLRQSRTGRGERLTRTPTPVLPMCQNDDVTRPGLILCPPCEPLANRDGEVVFQICLRAAREQNCLVTDENHYPSDIRFHEVAL